MKRNNKRLVINALLLGIGAMLHQITPTLGLPMQPDFALAIMIIIMIVNREDYKTSLIAAIITGVFTALTTKFPGGQLPNLIDKVITVQIVYSLMFLIDKIKSRMEVNKSNTFEIVLIMAIGTLVSGVTFLGSAQMLFGLPAGFNVLFATVVLPTIILNSIAGVFLYRIIIISLKRVALQ